MAMVTQPPPLRCRRHPQPHRHTLTHSHPQVRSASGGLCHSSKRKRTALPQVHAALVRLLNPSSHGGRGDGEERGCAEHRLCLALQAVETRPSKS